MKTLVAIGDSLVEGEGDDLALGGWPGRVARTLKPNLGRQTDGWQVYNLGIGGNTIKDVDSRLGEVLVRTPDVIVIGCGANDVMGQDARSRGMLSHYQDIWEKVLHKTKAMTPRVLVLFGFYAQTEAYADNWRKDYGTMYADHEKTVMGLCKKLDVPFIQLGENFAAPEILTDGLHFNAKGYDILAQMVRETLEDEKWI